uniref:Uncharacterized protein n=1 Tax=Ascaris lumbricoides TaxID=6252 RepID=A0A0M3I6E5_ASCLU
MSSPSSSPSIGVCKRRTKPSSTSSNVPMFSLH